MAGATATGGEMSGQCKDCRHWEEHKGLNFGTCRRVERLLVWDKALRGKAGNSNWFSVGSNSAEEDDEELDTGPDFGCVQFEAKP